MCRRSPSHCTARSESCCVAPVAMFAALEGCMVGTRKAPDRPMITASPPLPRPPALPGERVAVGGALERVACGDAAAQEVQRQEQRPEREILQHVGVLVVGHPDALVARRIAAASRI